MSLTKVVSLLAFTTTERSWAKYAFAFIKSEFFAKIVQKRLMVRKIKTFKSKFRIFGYFCTNPVLSGSGKHPYPAKKYPARPEVPWPLFFYFTYIKSHMSYNSCLINFFVWPLLQGAPLLIEVGGDQEPPGNTWRYPMGSKFFLLILNHIWATIYVL